MFNHPSIIAWHRIKVCYYLTRYKACIMQNTMICYITPQLTAIGNFYYTTRVVYCYKWSTVVGEHNSNLAYIFLHIHTKLIVYFYTHLRKVDLQFLKNRLIFTFVCSIIIFSIYLRLTGDVQEFKSSFKMCISQGLRAATQVRNKWVVVSTR